MRKKELSAIFASFLMAGTVLTACNTSEKQASEGAEEKKQEQTVDKEETKKESEINEVNYAQVFQEAITELEKAKAGKEVDFDKVTDLYKNNLQSLVQDRDAEFEDKLDQHITTALQAGKEGTMDKVVVKQIFDKLMQKVFYTTMKHDFTEVDEKWGNKEDVTKEIEEAKGYYAILQSTVEKRDAAYGTNMVDVIAGGFAEMEKAVEADDQVGFSLGKQVVDKTIMKTFYLATGAVPNGYATKVAEAAKKDKEEAKVEQAEGWAFYQSLFGYLNGHAPEEAAFIQQQFDLQTDSAKLDPAEVNKAFVRGFSKIALDEYKESEEFWGEDKSPITALEGALFIDIIGEDIKGLIGEAEYSKLTDNAQQYLEAAKAKDKKAGEPLLKELQATLQSVIEKAK
ncbi:UNVERIFIED_ORG: formylglycine-generating enzyme required for sulfatase activity [Peribacillus simplex]